MIRPLKKLTRLSLAVILFPIAMIALFFIGRMGQAAADYLWRAAAPALEDNSWWLLLMAIPGFLLPIMVVMFLCKPVESRTTSKAS